MTDETVKPAAKPKAAPKPKPPAAAAASPFLTGPGGTPIIPSEGSPAAEGDAPPRHIPLGNTQTSPTRGTRKRRAKQKVTDAQIRDTLCEILTMPAMPYAMIGHDWPAQHVLKTGPDLADALVGFSKTNDWLRNELEKLVGGDSALGMMMAASFLLMTVASYVIPQLAYFGFVPPELGHMFVKGEIPSPPPPVTTTAPPPAHNGPAAQAFPA